AAAVNRNDAFSGQDRLAAFRTHREDTQRLAIDDECFERWFKLRKHCNRSFPRHLSCSATDWACFLFSPVNCLTYLAAPTALDRPSCYIKVAFFWSVAPKEGTPSRTSVRRLSIGT